MNIQKKLADMVTGDPPVRVSGMDFNCCQHVQEDTC